MTGCMIGEEALHVQLQNNSSVKWIQIPEAGDPPPPTPTRRSCSNGPTWAHSAPENSVIVGYGRCSLSLPGWSPRTVAFVLCVRPRTVEGRYTTSILQIRKSFNHLCGTPWLLGPAGQIPWPERCVAPPLAGCAAACRRRGMH